MTSRSCKSQKRTAANPALGYEDPYTRRTQGFLDLFVYLSEATRALEQPFVSLPDDEDRFTRRAQELVDANPTLYANPDRVPQFPDSMRASASPDKIQPIPEIPRV
jgi:hypothetical protein